jgi:hypothetical protein
MNRRDFIMRLGGAAAAFGRDSDYTGTCSLLNGPGAPLRRGFSSWAPSPTGGNERNLGLFGSTNLVLTNQCSHNQLFL